MWHSADDHKLVIVYDGHCPFCDNYVRLMALRQIAGDVELIDARSAHPVVRRLEALGYALDEGMAVICGEKIYHGADAVILISNMIGEGSWIAKFLAVLLRKPVRAKVLYPIMKYGRRITLRLLGTRHIADERGTVV
jgi:predicted DCC family thiol-disulfide oxidoreductase YuxK